MSSPRTGFYGTNGDECQTCMGIVERDVNAPYRPPCPTCNGTGKRTQSRNPRPRRAADRSRETCRVEGCDNPARPGSDMCGQIKRRTLPRRAADRELIEAARELASICTANDRGNVYISAKQAEAERTAHDNFRAALAAYEEGS